MQQQSRSCAMRSIAYRLVGVQALVGIVVACLWLINGWHAGVSAILGVVACVLPSGYFANRFFATVNPGAVKRILINFYLGEFTKLLISAIALVLMIAFMHVAIIACITGYLGAQFGFWIAPLFVSLP